VDVDGVGSASTDLVDRLEAEYLPELRSLQAALAARFRHLIFTVYSSPVGTLTTFKGHGIGIECLFPDKPADRSDNVALSIDVCHLDRTPLRGADVCWGHPSGYLEDSLIENTEASTSDDWREANEATLARLRELFPRLSRAFVRAVERGEPGPAGD